MRSNITYTSALSIFIYILVVPLVSRSQPLSFQKTIGGTQSDYCYSVTATTDGGYVLTGNTYSFSNGFDDAYIIKVDYSGKILWTTTVGWGGNEDARSVVELSNKVFLAIGTTSSRGAGSKDILGIWLNQWGDTLWTRTYGKKNADVGFDIIKTGENCLITGVTRNATTEKSDIYLLKINANGDTLFTKTIGGKENEIGYNALVTKQGDYMIIGTTSTSSRGDNDIYIVRVDENGNKLWERNYGTLNADRAVSLVQFSDTIFYLTGAIRYNGADDYDLFVMKINAQGDSIWLKTYGDTLFDEGNKISLSNDNNLLVVGTTQSYGAGSKDMLLLKISPEGDLLQQFTYGGMSSDDAVTGFQTKEGGYLLAGYTSSYGVGGADMFLVKTLPDGTLSIYEDVFKTTKKGFYSIANENYLLISFTSGSFSKYTRFSVLDITGREIIYQDLMGFGSNQFSFPIENLACGMYLFKLTGNNGQVDFGKFVK